MRTRDRPNFSKKLVKTTSISVALFVAAILVFSAMPTIATPGNTTKLNKIEDEEMRADPTGLDPKWTEQSLIGSQQGANFKPLEGRYAEIMHGYVAYGASSPHPEGPCYYPLNDPGTITSLDTTTSAYFLAGGTWSCDDIWYGCEYNSGSLWTIDPDDGEMIQIGGGGTACNGLAWDPVYNRLYGASSTHLIEYDPETGEQESIGSFGLSGKTIIGMAIDLEGRAFIWDVLFSGQSTLWEVDLTSGEATEYASIGQPLVYAQDGAFDWDTGILWFAAYYSYGFLAYWDFTNEDEFIEVDNFEGNAEITCSAIIADCIPPEHDVGVKAILKPTESGHAVPEMEMELLVKNYGANPETFDAQMEIIKCESSGTFLLDEDFSGGVIPAGWETDYWNIQYSNMASGESPEARVYRYDQYYGGQYYDNYIMTSQVDATGWEKIQMAFRWAFQQYSTYGRYCNFYVKWQRNSTSPWKDLSPWDNPLNEDYEGDLYNIDCYGFGESLGDEFRVRFEYVGYYYYFQYFWLDDIQIEGCGGCAEYAELEEDLTLGPGEEMTVVFPGWPPSEWHNESYQDTWEAYPVHGFTIMEGDQRPRNNDKWILLELYYPWFFDIEITEIGSPKERSMPAKTFPVEATITNVGQFESCCIGIDIEIGAPYVSDTLFAEYDWPTTGWPYYWIYGPGYGSGWRDEHKNLVYYYGWRVWTGTPYSGGDPYEAYLYYYYARADKHFYSMAIDTSEFSSLQLSFLSYVNHYSGSGLYALEAGYSHDGENWYAAWHEEPSSSGEYEVSVPIEGGSETTYIGFWCKGNPYYFNYWYVDNVKLEAVGIDVEYTDFMCQGDDLLPGQSRVFNFDDWTPDFLQYETTAWEVPYKVGASIDVTQDQDPGNNVLVQNFELDYWHDPALEAVTSPAPLGGRELLWENGEPDGRNGLASTYYQGYNNMLIDDVELEKDSFVTGGDFSLVWNSGAGEGNCDTVIMRFFEETGDCEPSEDEYAEIEVSGFEEEETGDYYFGRPEVVITVEFDEVALPAGNWWVSFQADSVGEDIGYWLTAESKGCMCHADLPYWGYPRWSSSQYLWGSEYDLAFAITGYSTGPPPPSVWIQAGTESIDAMAINHGTFPELDLVADAEIWEFITDPENGTLQYQDQIVDIDLDTPLGGTVPLPFDDFTFAYEGRYGLFINMPDSNGDDDFPGNNLIRYGIAVDGTNPVSSHTLDPPNPDGENGWYVNDLEVTLDAYDPWSNDVSSGVAEIKYKVGNEPEQTITGNHGTFLITQANDAEDLVVTYYAIDNVGNVEATNTITPLIDMDQTDPTVDLTYEVESGDPIQGWVMLFTATCDDLTSGMDRVEFFLNEGHQETVTGPGPTYQWSFVYHGDFSVDIRCDAYDVAGNMAQDIVEDPKPAEYNNFNMQQSVKILQQ
jgi:hypothetical protein